MPCTPVHWNALSAGIPNLPLAVSQVAKAPDGTVWIAEGFSGSLTAYTAVGGAGTSVAAAAVQSLVMDRSGIPWTLEAAGVVLRDNLGNPLITTATTLATPRILLTGASGTTWVVGTSPVQLQRISAGAPTGPVIGASGITLEGAVSDPSGAAWLLTNAGLEVFDVQGTPLASFTVPGIGNRADVTVDSIGRIRVLVAGGGSGTLVTYDPQTLAQTGVLPLPSTSSPYTHARFDHVGRCWLENAFGGATLIDPTGAPIGTVASLGGLPPLFLVFPGDPAGASLLSVVDPGGDADLDGVGNQVEAPLGADPLDPLSQPAQLGLLGGAVAGQVVSAGINAPQDAGFLFATMASFGNGPFQPSPFLPLRLPLSPDLLFTFWIGPGNFVLTGPLIGTLSNVGAATVGLQIPPGTSGISFQLGAVIIDPATLLPVRLSPALTVQVQ